MPECVVLAPTPDPRVFVAPDGTRCSPPDGWACLPPGDAALTRRVKLAGPSWAVIEKRGRKAFSKGLWAPRENIESQRLAVEAERSTEAYAKKRQPTSRDASEHKQSTSSRSRRRWRASSASRPSGSSSPA